MFSRFASISCFALLLFASCTLTPESNEDPAVLAAPIVGGIEAISGAWPTVVSVNFKNFPGPWWCGGTLIRSDWVLSAAHCFAADGMGNVDASRYEVFVGRHDITSSDGHVHAVDQVLLHPDTDVALLHLTTAVSGVTPSRLVAPGRMSEIGTGSETVVLGWGDLAWGGPSSETLQQVTVSVIGVGADCDAATSFSGIRTDEICIGELPGGQDSCQADSGGPAFVHRDGEWFVLGVVSWGIGCAWPNLPGVYAFAPTFLDWTLANAPGGKPSWLPSAQIMTILAS